MIRRISSRGLLIERRNQFANPVVREFHRLASQNWRKNRRSPPCKQAYVIDAIAHHRQPRQTQTERESAPLVRIDSAHAQHIRMHQATRQQLHPTALLAHRTARSTADQALNVQLEPWFDERKIAGPQTHGHFAVEDRAEQGLHEVDQVRDRDVAIHHHAFHLIEGVLVRGVHFFVAKNAAGRDHPQRRPQLLHAAHLHRRGVRAQQMAVGEPKGVLHVARRMFRRNVERVEIVIFGFDLGTVQHRESQ